MRDALGDGRRRTGVVTTAPCGRERALERRRRRSSRSVFSQTRSGFATNAFGDFGQVAARDSATRVELNLSIALFTELRVQRTRHDSRARFSQQAAVVDVRGALPTPTPSRRSPRAAHLPRPLHALRLRRLRPPQRFWDDGWQKVQGDQEGLAVAEGVAVGNVATAAVVATDER